MYSKEEAQRLKREFWIAFAEKYPRKWLLYDTKIKDFSFKFFVDNKKAQVLIDIEPRNDEKRIAYFEKLEALKASAEGRVWLVGGGEVANLFIKENLLDEIILTVIPETIGAGIPWLGNVPLAAGWTLSEHYISRNNVVQLVYARR